MTNSKSGNMLNEQQQEAFDTLRDYIKGKIPGFTMYTLEGYAGTGKTYTISRLVETVKKEMGESYTIAVSAPTHKAVKVLKKMRELTSSVVYATIHSLLGLKPAPNYITGVMEYKQDPETLDRLRIRDVDLLIVDEVSMLDDELFNYLEEYAREGLKIIFMGDGVQIPPVSNAKDIRKKPKHSIPLQEAGRLKHNIGHLRLTKIVRQAEGNPILTFATAIRKSYQTAWSTPSVHLLEDGSGVDVIPEDNIIPILSSLFVSEEFKKDADYAKIIAWTNNTVDTSNQVVRELIYGQKNLPVLMVGEKLIMDSPLFDSDNKKNILLHNNDEVEVKDFKVASTHVEYMAMDERKNVEEQTAFIKYYNTLVNYEDIDRGNVIYRMHIVHDDSVKDYQKIIKGLEEIGKTSKNPDMKRKAWRMFFHLKDKMFANVKYNYAITAHKAQGSSYTNTIVIDWDIHQNRDIEERNRIRYVAVSRPRHKLIMIE